MKPCIIPASSNTIDETIHGWSFVLVTGFSFRYKSKKYLNQFGKSFKTEVFVLPKMAVIN